jgi:hypothetical protein
VRHLGHLIRWDVRRVRAILAVWIALVVGYTLLVGIRPHAAADTALRESIAVVDSVLWLTMLLLTFALVSFVIHADPTVGTDAFWMTRPIPPATLLASKLVLLGLALLVIPVTAESMLLASNRMPASTSLGVLAQTSSIRLVVITLLVIAAAVTRNLPRFALLCGATLLAFAVAFGISIAVLMRNVEDQPPGNTSSRAAEDPSALVVFNALFVAAALVMLAVQYRTKLKRRSIAVGAAGVAAALVVGWLWPIPFLQPRFETPEWAEHAETLSIRIDPATISTNRPEAFFASRRFEWATVNGLIHAEGVQPGWSASVALRDATLDLPNGVTLRSGGSWRSFLVVGGSYVPEPGYATARELLGVTTLATYAPAPLGPPPPQARPALFVMRRDQVAEHLPARGHYRAHMDINLTQYVVQGAIPIVPGASLQNGGYRLVVDRTTWFDSEFAIVAREARATSMWERRPWAEYSFYLRNRQRGEAVLVSDYVLHSNFSILRFLPIGQFSIGSSQTSGFSSRGMVLRIPPRYGPRGTTLDLDDAWLAAAELVIVRRTEEGWVERTVEIPDFPIGQ